MRWYLTIKVFRALSWVSPQLGEWFAQVTGLRACLEHTLRLLEVREQLL